MPLTGAQLITDWIEAQGIEAVFLVPGLQIDPLFKQLASCPRLKTVVANHELAAGFMADGYARASQRLGVCAGIGTVGASNMLTAALTARADDSAVLFLSGNVPWRLRGHGAFQDAWASGSNDTGVYRHALGQVAVVRNGVELQEQLGSLATALVHPHRKPALLSVPNDVLKAEVSECLQSFEAGAVTQGSGEASARAILERSGLSKRLASARRPILLVGGRAVSSELPTLLRQFAETYQIPVATTLSAKGLLEETHPLSLRNFGFGGSRRANEALLSGNPDLVLLLGAHLSERDSFCWDLRLRPTGATLLQIDPKTETQRHELQPDISVHLDCTEALHCLLEARKTTLRSLCESALERQAWLKLLRDVPCSDTPPDAALLNGDGISLEHVMLELRRSLPDDAILVVDAGLHRVFSGHYWTSRQPGTFFSACGLAPMGWAIAAAVGIQIARPTQPVVVLTGDGCMRAHGNELGVMARYGLPITVVVCNNGGYGSIHRRFDADDPAKAMAQLPAVDWAQFAAAFGVRGARARHLPELKVAIKKALAGRRASNGYATPPSLIEVITPEHQPLPGPGIVCSALTIGESVRAKSVLPPRRVSRRTVARKSHLSK